MSVKPTCNTCNKSVSCKTLIYSSVFLTKINVKDNNFNVVDAEIKKILAQIDFGFARNVRTICFLSLLQMTPTVTFLTPILLKHVQTLSNLR